MILELLRAFFRLGVEGEPGDAPPEEEAAPEAEPEVEVEAEPEHEESSPEADAALAAIRAEKERGDRLEREMADLRQRQPQRPHVDETVEAENKKLADPATTAAERWQIESNRVIRATQQNSQLALIQAQDIADKTSFARIAMTNAALFKRYETRVEEELGKMRAKGFNASREQIMDNLIGKDMREGKFTKAKKADEPAAGKSAVARGKTPGAKSDVGGRQAMSEHEKRRARLENVQI